MYLPASGKHNWPHPISNKSISCYSGGVSLSPDDETWISTYLHISSWCPEVAKGTPHSLALPGWSWRFCSFMASPMLPAIFSFPWKKADWGFIFPVIKASKSESAMVIVQSAFLSELGSTDPLPFFTSTTQVASLPPGPSFTLKAKMPPIFFTNCSPSSSSFFSISLKTRFALNPSPAELVGAAETWCVLKELWKAQCQFWESQRYSGLQHLGNSNFQNAQEQRCYNSYLKKIFSKYIKQLPNSTPQQILSSH